MITPTENRIESKHGPLLLRERVSGLEHPWSLAVLPDGDLLVTERPGRLRRISLARGTVSAPIAGLPGIYAEGQAGLLDVALSPDFMRDGLLYFAFAEPNLRGNLCGTTVARGRLDGTVLRDVRVIYRQAPKKSAGSHLGARLAFDGKGHLFITQGDHRVYPQAAQELGSLQGKIVRIDPDGGTPSDNPFADVAGARGEIWSIGHRNVQGAAIHPRTRELWTNEHGPMGGDELNIAQAGRNYGWPVITDGINYDGKPVPGAIGRTAPGMEAPLRSWTPSPALSGMAFHSGRGMPAWRDNLFIGALAGRRLIRLQLDGDAVVDEEALLGDRQERIRDVREGPGGVLYILTDENAGKLIELRPLPADDIKAAASDR